MIFIKEIPTRLQCAYCIRNHSHGGECYRNKFDDIGCLAFSLDPKGCIRTADIKMAIPLYFEIPQVGMWSDNWTMKGIDTQVKINRIHGIKWDTRKGNLILLCNCEYYVNEFHEDYKGHDDKPKLKIVK